MPNPRRQIDDLKLQGSGNLKRAQNRRPVSEKKFIAGTPEPPTHLSADERAAWDRVVGLLSVRRALTPADVFVVERYSVIYARWRSEQTALTEEGTVIEVFKKAGKDHNGVYVSVVNPRLRVVQSCERQLLDLDRELGLTPAHRGRPDETRPPLSIAELLKVPVRPE